MRVDTEAWLGPTHCSVPGMGRHRIYRSMIRPYTLLSVKDR